MLGEGGQCYIFPPILVVHYLTLACPPKIGPLEMRDSCRITTGGSKSENEKVYGGAGISDSPGG